MTSVGRFYQRNSLVSSLHPLHIFVKVDPVAASVDDPLMKIREITDQCLLNQIDGIIIENQSEGSIPN